MSFRVALLLHLTPWDKGSRSPILLVDGISYGKLTNSDVGKLYEKICADNNVDDGEPFEYSTYFDVDLDKDGTDMDFQSPYSIFMRLCNMLVICSDNPVGMARAIVSDDNYKTSKNTFEVFSYTFQDQQIKWFSVGKQQNNYLHLLGTYLELEKTLFDKWTYSSRVANALIYFFYAWRSYHIEPACINLSIVLESLFGPESTTELAHQIAFNVSRFRGAADYQRRDLYKRIKKFYAVRSKIMHGSVPKDDDVLETLNFMFPLLCSILRKIMTDKQTFEAFHNDRSALLERWLFE